MSWDNMKKQGPQKTGHFKTYFELFLFREQPILFGRVATCHFMIFFFVTAEIIVHS